MKEFNLELAKQGKPVCTIDGRRARILCFDLKYGDYPICAAVEIEEGTEKLYTYTLDGRYRMYEGNDADLMMAPEKHEGWINIGRKDNEMYAAYVIYPSEEVAREMVKDAQNYYIATVRIEWEE